MSLNIAIAKIGANITFSSRNGSAASADIIYALRTLKGFKHKFTIVTQKTSNTVIPNSIKLQEIGITANFNDFDLVLLFNGTINFFGGVANEQLFSLYRALSKTNKPIIYVQTDGAMYLQNLWNSIKGRDWANNLTPEEFEINADNVYYLTQGRIIQRTRNAIEHKKGIRIVPKGIFHFPWEQTILSEYERYLPYKHTKRIYDLGFGGYIRNAYKQRRIEKYYDEPDLSTLLFGNLRGIKLRNTKVKPKVPYQEMINTMAQCKATVIVGDEEYNNHFHTLRMYECLLAGNLVFIDKVLDDRATFYAGIPNSSWFLVESTEDVRNKLWTVDEEFIKETQTKVIEDRLQRSLSKILNNKLEDILCDHQ